MGLLFMIVVGTAFGWLASIVLRIEAPRAILLNIGAGIAGALLMGMFVGPLFGAPSLFGGDYGVDSLVLSVAGAVALVAALNVASRRQAR